MTHIEQWDDKLVPAAVVVGTTRFELTPRLNGEYWVKGLGKMSLGEVVEYASQIAAQEGRWVAKEYIHVQVVFRDMTYQVEV